MKNFHLLLPASVLGLAAMPALGEAIYALEDVGTTQQLQLFDTNTPGTAGAASVPITGLVTDERVLGIDFRPQTGQLYALGNSDAVYTVDPATGVATRVGSGFSDGLSGSFYGFDFNPVIDKIRIVSDLDQNHVANPDSGDANIASTTPVFYANGDPNTGADPNVINHAYTNAFADADSTQLYAIDSDLDILVTQANNAGTLGTVGTLGVDVLTIGGFDISGASDVAYLAATVKGNTGSTLFSVDLSTGAATALGTIGSGEGLTVDGLAVAPDAPNVIPSPAALPAGLLGLAALLTRRRRA